MLRRIEFHIMTSALGPLGRDAARREPVLTFLGARRMLLSAPLA
jgi:hypothetical protein